MIHPFKRLETSWNARTPKFLHNRTKENLIFQLTLTALLLIGINLKGWWDDRQEKKRLRLKSNVIKLTTN